MHWTGQFEDGKEIDLTKIPCATGWGASDCWPCYKLLSIKDTLKDALELWINGRTTVMVSSRRSKFFHSLDAEDISVDWWQ